MHPVAGVGSVDADDEFFDLLAALILRCRVDGVDMLNAFKVIDKLSTKRLTEVDEVD